MEENSIYSSWQKGESGRCRCSLSHPIPGAGTSGGPIWAVPDALTTVLPAEGEFPVVVQRTEAATRCQLKGPYLLVLGQDAIQLREPSSPQALYTWPYRFLRKFGSDKVRCWTATQPHWPCWEGWQVKGCPGPSTSNPPKPPPPPCPGCVLL